MISITNEEQSRIKSAISLPFVSRGVATGHGGMEWEFTYDKYGRPVKARSLGLLQPKHLPLQPRATKGGSKANAHCDDSKFNSNYKTMMQNQPTVRVSNSKFTFQAGHIVPCQLGCPQGLNNFVPQAVDSNTKGCWYHSEISSTTLIRQLGCESRVEMNLGYLDDDDITIVLQKLRLKYGAYYGDKLAALYNQFPSNTGKVKLMKQCILRYRPVTMQFKMRIVNAQRGSKCEHFHKALDSLEGAISDRNKGFSISRPVMYWLLRFVEGGSYVLFHQLNEKNECFNDLERTDYIQNVPINNDFEHAFLMARDGDNPKKKICF